MIVFEKHIPIHPLCEFIEHFIYYKGFTPEHKMERFLPDGNVELLIDLTEKPKYIFDNEAFTIKQSCRRSWLSGVRNRYITIPSPLDFEMFLISFKKGMVHSFTGFPLSEISDTVVDANHVFGNIIDSLREQLLHCTGIRQKFITAEKVLLNSYGNRLQVNPFVQFAVSRIAANPSTTSMRAIAAKTGYSQKHFIHLFRSHVGVTPKAYLRILRFQKAVQQIEATGQVNWAGIALDCGFYDQAHFIEDFKSFSGFTPADYFTRKTGKLNYIPVG